MKKIKEDKIFHKWGDAWLVRDKFGKMRRGLFFHPSHAYQYQSELYNLRLEVVKVRVSIIVK